MNPAEGGPRSDNHNPLQPRNLSQPMDAPSAKTKSCAPTASKAFTGSSKKTTPPSSFRWIVDVSGSSSSSATPSRSAPLELPQGGWRWKSRILKNLRAGELKEEIGLIAAQMTYLGWLWIAYGFTRQKHHVFLASGLTENRKRP